MLSVRYIRAQDDHHKKMDYKSELIALLETSLCRAYGAHNSMPTLPTALPWAKLPVRLTARGVQWELTVWTTQHFI